MNELELERAKSFAENHPMTCSDVSEFESLACVCGLSFPESAIDFQKSMLTLAHLMAAVRESVLKGADIPLRVLFAVHDLAHVAVAHYDAQK